MAERRYVLAPKQHLTRGLPLVDVPESIPPYY